ncbi:MAG TPA: NADPH:quinone oxidoreductase family protein [Kofleriaceae bacterium]|nr:NADPH:quinone oxidoreductase family protein [Kofleriaceae bacterium]
MRAWRIHQHGAWREQLRLEEAPDPAPPDDGVVVHIAAAALNFPDLLAIAGQYQVKPPLPFIPGMEAAGEVVAAGPRSALRPGQRVIVSATGGGFAERVAADDAHCYPMPDAMTDADAAALLVVYQTGWLALVRRARLRAGETLLVHGGAGGVGTAAIQLGKALGARVIATASGAAKLDVCRSCGADEVFDYRERPIADAVAELTGGRGADVIYDPIGGDVFDASTRCLAFEGRLLVIGFAGGRIPEIKANRILLKNIDVIGIFWGNYLLHDPAVARTAHDDLCRMYQEAAIRPVIYREYPLAELPAALAALEARESYGKIVVRP